MSMRSLKLDFKPLIKKLDFLSRKLLEGDEIGEYASPHRKRGMEFEEYKDFVPGDDASLIDWKASLRTGKLLVRQYTQTKNLNVIILMDVSNSMIYSSINKLKCEYAAEIAASLSYYLLKSGDSVGMIMFNDKIVKFLHPMQGNRQFFVISGVLSNPEFYGGDFDISNAINYAGRIAKHGTLIIIISDFIGLDSKWTVALSSLTKRADIVAIIVRDPQDNRLKAKMGTARIVDPYSERMLLVNMDEIKYSYEEASQRILSDVKDSLKKNRVTVIELETDKPFVEPIVKSFAKRVVK
ncbi:MAG TPA: DUF58 domain-containing protein [Candidatus Nanoarchaeia archaeon]|nr:DUF58 domain-containing protein [Candidatus Nanoarchaeia archaeon]